MKCDTCGNQKTVLLYSTVCDHCEKEASLVTLIQDALKRLSDPFKDDSIPKKSVTRKPLGMPTSRLLTTPAGIEPPVLSTYRRPSPLDIARSLFPVEPMPEVAKVFFSADFSEAELHVLGNLGAYEHDDQEDEDA